MKAHALKQRSTMMIACTLILWLHVDFIKKELPHTYVADCLIIKQDKVVLDTGSPDHILVDCTKSVSWINTKHRSKKGPLWLTYDGESCYE